MKITMIDKWFKKEIRFEGTLKELDEFIYRMNYPFSMLNPKSVAEWKKKKAGKV